MNGTLQSMPAVGEIDGVYASLRRLDPQIAGKNIANPMATILKAAMMLDWLGDKHNDSVCSAATATLENAVAQILADGEVRTPDIGGKSSTTDVAHAVADTLSTVAHA